MIYLSWRHSIVAVLCCLVGMVAFILPFQVKDANAATLQRYTYTHPSNRQATQGHVTIIVLDMSGSMATNDPQGLRCSAANAYIDLSGVNDYIGIVGLDNNNGSRVGSDQFQAAQIWTSPINTATLRDRNNLHSIITSNSRACQPDNTTPTYDSLAKALNLLGTTASSKKLTGSVILLTDGAPSPDTTQQIAKIKSQLVPQFKQNNWPIDTIALGVDGPVVTGSPETFHSFLSDVASGTGGKFYDDGKGPIAGVSPLNIAPFFVDIFARRAGRTVGQDVPPTQLDGGTKKRNFTVTDFTNNLDVVVVKDQPGTSVTLVSPDGQTIKPGDPAVLGTDPHYFIFSIPQPVAGQWEVDVTGSGQFLLDSLKTSNIGISIDKVELKDANLPSGNVWPLGQTLSISANLTSNGVVITDNTFKVTGNISYTGSSGQYSQDFTLDDNAAPGTYVGFVTVPTSASAGSYDIRLGVSTVSIATVIASSIKSVRLELFPVPLLISAQTNTPTDTTISTTVLQWPQPIQFLYSLPILSNLSGWPLQNHSALPYTNIHGLVQWQGRVYPGAQISSQAFLQNVTTAIPVTVSQDGQGNFKLQFIPSKSGSYRLVFLTSGSYKDSHGDFGPTVREVNVTVIPASGPQILQASGVSIFYLFVVLFIIFFIKFLFTPAPYGGWERVQGGEVVGGFRFSRSRRGLWQSFVSRNIVDSRQAGMPRGLRFRFQRGGIEVCGDERGSEVWQTSEGSKIRTQYQRVRSLVFMPGNSGDDAEDISSYTIMAQKSKVSSDDTLDGYSPRASSRKPRKAAYSYEESYDQSPSAKKGRTKKRSQRNKSTQWDDDYL